MQIGGKPPSVSTLQAEYEKLQAQKESLYADYVKLQAQKESLYADYGKLKKSTGV